MLDTSNLEGGDMELPGTLWVLQHFRFDNHDPPNGEIAVHCAHAHARTGPTVKLWYSRAVCSLQTDPDHTRKASELGALQASQPSILVPKQLIAGHFQAELQLHGQDLMSR